MKKLLTAILLSTIVLFAFVQSPPIDLHKEWSELLKKHVTPSGKVNYKGFIKDSEKLNSYLRKLEKNPPKSDWKKNDIMAYWINAYNAYTVRLICDNYPVKSIKEIGGKIPFVNSTWDIKFITIDGEEMDLNNIEHGKLRKQYKDARVHFALVCASKSCPILRNEAYIGSKLDAQLKDQAENFLKDTFRNKVDKTNPKLSKIFDWYGMDFKSKDMTLIQYVNQYSPVKIDEKAKVEYLDYDWGLNE
jgi:hypothetical protein